ncbi:hypothetical protein G8E10_17850 [Rhizobiaceae bacterium CRRU44]|uniref:Uncharacterized protein n=1 Tax=Ferranicluibacter rubi TaxID=2715133 RepID=A0AA43ZH75_9HYPH|nr:hypothetical protein [Ferranicluibacter rubi]NHT77579.1 hypothetical protein [Ferranicluibacter rubi]
MRKVYMCAALGLGIAVSPPAVAALGDPASYSSKGIVVAGLDYSTPTGSIANDKTADICVPPEEQYIPSFVRDMRGRIVGVNYTIIEYVC